MAGTRNQRLKRGPRRVRTVGVPGVVVLAMGMILAACTSTTHSPLPSSAPSSTTTSMPSTTTPTSTTAPATNTPPASLGSYLPLFPFTTAQEVQA